VFIAQLAKLKQHCNVGVIVPC
jgi:hypothetical protein